MRTLRTGTSRIHRCPYKSVYRVQKPYRYTSLYRRKWLRRFYQDMIKSLSLAIVTIMIGVTMMTVTADDAISVTKDSLTIKSVKEIPVVNEAHSSSVTTMEFTTPKMKESQSPIVQLPYVEDDIDPMTLLSTNLGNESISIGSNTTLNRYELPNIYYPGIDFSSFQPYMDYRCITNTSSPAYAVSHSQMAYTDEYGMRRYRTTEDQFTINGNDDYVIALGTYYKEKGTAGSRYLIVTTTGMYTAITGDEKADSHTDSRHMFSLHRDGTGGIIEWIVDQRNLETKMRRSGTITAGPIEPLQGEILHIYGIE